VGDHCAVRVVGNDGKMKFGGELLNEKTNAIRALSDDASDASAYSWTTLPVPAGMSADQFAARIMSSYYTVGASVEGRRYSMDGNVNSNKFVFSVVTGAGGEMPRSVHRPGRVTPGICGGVPGRPLQPGFSCK